MTEQTERGFVLDERARTLSTRRGVWTVEAKHTRASGDVDVVLGFRVTGKSRVRLYGFRRDQGEWRQLAGTWTQRATAVRQAATITRTQVFATYSLIPLLILAAAGSDFPPTPDVRGGEPLTDAEERAYRDEQADDLDGEA